MAKHVVLGFCIRYVSDVEKTIAFYERAFGMDRRFVAEGGGYGELKGPPPLGFASDAQATSLIGAIAAGAVAVAAPAEKPWGQIVAYVGDCDGGLVEICTSWQ